MKLGEHLRLSPVLRGAREPYRYEREVEEFLRWSPHVRNSRDGAGDVARTEPARARRRPDEIEAEAHAGSPRGERGRGARRARRAGREALERPRSTERRAPRPRRQRPRPAAPPQPPAPVEHYDDLAAEEVIALLGSLEAGDLAVLRDLRARARAPCAASWRRSNRCWPAAGAPELGAQAAAAGGSGPLPAAVDSPGAALTLPSLQ